MNLTIVSTNYNKLMFVCRDKTTAIEKIRQYFPNAMLLPDMNKYLINIALKWTVGQIEEVYSTIPGFFTVELFNQGFILFDNEHDRESWLTKYFNEHTKIAIDNKFLLLDNDKEIVGQLRYLAAI